MKCKFLYFIVFLSSINIFAMTEPEWIYLRDMPKGTEDVTHDEWRIQDKQLEVNLSVEDAITFEPFSKSLKKAKKNQFPFLLVALKNKDDFYHFFAPAIGQNIEDNSGSLLTDFASRWVNPETNVKIYQAEVYFAGPDGNFYLLTDDASQEFFQKKLCKQDTKYKVTPELATTAKSGEAYFYVANLYLERAYSLSPEASQKRKKLEIAQQELAQYKLWGMTWSVDQKQGEIKHLQNELESIKLPKEAQQLEQIARRWFEWALEHLDRFSSEYSQALKIYNLIPNQPGLLTYFEKKVHGIKTPVNGNNLIYALQNLEKTLQKLRQSFKSLKI